MDALSHDDEEHMLLTEEVGDGRCTSGEQQDERSARDKTGTSHLDQESVKARGYVDSLRQHQDGDDSSDMDGASSDSEVDSSSMTTTSSSHSSRSWEILDGPEPDTLQGEVDREALAAAAAESEAEEPGLVESVSRDAKHVLDGIKTEMREISDGYSMIASGVDKVTTGLAEKLNKAFVVGAKSAENAVSSLAKDWFDDKEKEGASTLDKVSGEVKLDSEGNRTPGQKALPGVTGTASSGSFPHSLTLTPSQEDNKSVDNATKDNQTLRKITSVIHNNSSLLPINLRALHTEGLFSPTNEYPSSQVSTEISYCGPGEQMIIETQQNDPFDPIAVLVVYEIISVKSKESVGYLRLQAVWHCFEPAPRVGVSLGSEPTPSTEGDAVTSLEVADGVRLRCLTKQLDAVEGDYFVQSITVTSEEVGSIAMVGRSFEKLIQKFKAF